MAKPVQDRRCPATVSSSEQVRPPALVSSPHSRDEEVGTAFLECHSPSPAQPAGDFILSVYTEFNLKEHLDEA